MTNSERIHDNKKVAKAIMEDAGIKIFIKDIKEVTIHKMLKKDEFWHRRIFRIEMMDGTVYEAINETVKGDDNGFSMESAKWFTREVRRDGEAIVRR